MATNCSTIIRALFDLIKRALFQRSPTQEEAEEDTDSPGTQRRDVQPGPSSDPPVNRGVIGLPSSSSSCSSGEGSVNNKFDVFISHRGPDTKYNLAYSIYFLLQERGVEAFLDREELQSGERFPEAIKKAIACSKVDVCILSSGFAESVWCLKELVMMLHKFESGLSTLIPIFYDVKPAEVRHLKGAFGQGFENLQSKDRNSSKDVEQWRHALGKIGDISGYEGKCELCRIIVNKICELLHVRSVATPRKVLGIEKQLLSSLCNIMECHENGRAVTSVEISGIGGIGKTTFAKELYNKICHKFERSCFIEDVNGLIEKHGINEVHKQLLNNLFGQDSSSFRMEKKNHLVNKLHKAKILVVFDNIHSKIPLSKVFIEGNVSLSERSIIIVTSREKGVLKHDPEVKEYCKNLIPLKIETLDLYTSKQLFCHYAFGSIDNVQDKFNALIEQMVKKCDGLPLALTLLGTHVYNKEIIFWENFINFIQDSLHSKVKDKLKFSYDNLGTDLEKCLFLDVATFFRGEKESLLIQLRQRNEEDGKSVQYALDMLKSKLLINVSFDGVLSMHDVLVDLGRNIVKDENSCPGHRSRVWYPSDVTLMLSDELGTKKVKALSLVSQGSAILDKDQCPWPADVFSKLSSLEILILHDRCIEGDLSNLSKKLLWLRWTDFPYQEIPLKLCIKHLRVLEVTGENLIRLWAHPPQEAPSKLRQLIIPQCIKLEMLPRDIGRHLSLINLDKCISLKHIPDSFGQLRGLKHLRLWRCDALECLPETLGGLTSLRTLYIRQCCAVVSLPRSIRDLQLLCSIHLEECTSLKIIPDSVGQLTALKSFHLKNCKASKQLPGSFGDLFMKQLASLRYLQVSHIGFPLHGGPDQLPPPDWGPDQLREEGPGNPYFEWDWSTKLNDDMEVADSWFARMGNAVHPNFDFWKNYSRWHSQVPKPHNLRWLLREVAQHIQMKKNRYLDSIYNNNDAGASQARLEFIDFDFIDSASNITLPDKATILRLEGLWNLGNLPQSVGNHRYMTSLNLSYCYSLQELPKSLDNLSCLRELSLDWCCNLQQLPDSIGNLRNLRSLDVVGCLALKPFPSLRNLSRLGGLRVENCWMVEVIHIQGLFNLEKLVVDNCVNLKSIVGFSDLRKLEVLEIKRCMNLKSIVGLSKLEIEICMNLKSSVGSSVGLSNVCKLRRLEIRGCFGLTHMLLPVDGFASFNSLEHLIIDGCYQLRFSEALAERLPPNLSSYRLWDNHNLVHIEEDAHLRLERLNAKTSPLFCATVKERLTHVLRSSPEKPSFFVHEFAESLHVPSLPFIAHALVTCFVSSVYAYDFPADIPVPKTQFIINQYAVPSTIGYSVSSDFGEEINVQVHDIRHIDWRRIQRGDFDLDVNVCKDRRSYGYYDGYGRPYPSYEAGVKEAFIIFLDGEGREQSKTLASEILDIFVSELRKQRLMSRAWTELPSQLRIHDFSALDIAGCQITKTSRHCNTCIMEEETGLTWKIRRCIFMDDHSLLLQQPKNSKHSFLAYPGVDRDPEEKVANLYEMSISIFTKGKEVHSRKLQQISPKTEEEIPSPLNTLLQSRDFRSTSETMHRLSLLMVDMLRNKSIQVSFDRLENEGSDDDDRFEGLANESSDYHVRLIQGKNVRLIQGKILKELRRKG